MRLASWSSLWLLPFIVTLSSLPFKSFALRVEPSQRGEYFSGDSLVITCIDNNPLPNRNEARIQWHSPRGEELSRDSLSLTQVVDISGGQQLVVMKVTKKDAGEYKCIKFKGTQKLEIVSFNLKVYASIEFAGKSSEVADDGVPFTVPCIVKFDPEASTFSIYWFKDGNVIETDVSDKYAISETMSPNIRSNLMIRRMTKSDGGNYTCRATQVCGSVTQRKSWDVQVRVQYPPTFSEPERDIWVLDNDDLIELNVTCTVAADPPASVSWIHAFSMSPMQKNDYPEIEAIVDSENMSVLTLRFRYRSRNFRWNRNSVPKQFRCRAKNPLGDRFQLFTIRPGDPPSAPKLIDTRFDSTSNNLTLVVEKQQIASPLDYYRLDVGNGSSFILFNASAPDIRMEGKLTNSSTYTVTIKGISSGDHKLSLSAHNPVGWSQPLREAITLSIDETEEAKAKNQPKIVQILLSVLVNP